MTFYLLIECGRFGITLWPFWFVAVLDVTRSRQYLASNVRYAPSLQTNYAVGHARVLLPSGLNILRSTKIFEIFR